MVAICVEAGWLSSTGQAGLWEKEKEREKGKMGQKVIVTGSRKKRYRRREGPLVAPAPSTHITVGKAAARLPDTHFLLAGSSASNSKLFLV